MSDFLYQDYDSISKRGFLNQYKVLPEYLKDNLNPNFLVRDYQIEAFARFFFYQTDPEKKVPIHLLFNMATGSGKTLIMAGLILHLYTQGYRNFLFFVNSTNIISKTKDNFLNSFSSKYLFNQKLIFDSKEVLINEVNNFQESNPDHINICFSTIQGLHTNLINERENTLTIEDFKQFKIALISDESHHINSKTKSKTVNSDELFEDQKPSWENTVENVFTAHSENVLLEFTATLDFLDKNITDKYKSKIIYRYDLKSFRLDGFSKDVNILQSDSDDSQRMLQAVILNQYRQDVASKNKINLKPVILFKAQKTIKESHENKAKFENLIENLTVKDLENIKEKVNITIIQKALGFYPDLNFLLNKIQSNFSPKHLLTTNEGVSDEKANKNESKIQKDLNTLESNENQIRAIFTVNKLNEGWDVLNLFDIVRLYTQRDGDTDKKGDYIPGKTTIAEAQLIGRGARYYPFSVDENDGKFKRKFDDDIENEMRILEEIHYHSFNEPRYISEIRATLIKEGLLDEKTFTKELRLKSEFKNTEFYKKGFVLKNKQIIQDQEDQLSFEKLSFKSTNVEYKVFSGKGKETRAFDDFDDEKLYIQTKNKDFDLTELGLQIVKKAMQKDSFFSYSSLKEILPELKSTDDFIYLPKYLGGVKIRFNGPEKLILKPSSDESLKAILKLLEQVKSEMRNTTQKYKGSKNFDHFQIKNIFTDKTLKLAKDIEGDEDYLKDKSWYAFKSNYGTSEEKDMVKAIETQIETFKTKYEDIYLIRNERHFKVFRFSDGMAFEPDFVLFMRSKDKSNEITYQIFLEPKGSQFRGASGSFEDGKEAEKLKFLKELSLEIESEIKIFGTTAKYRIVGVPMFYNKQDENKFIFEISQSLELS